MKRFLFLLLLLFSLRAAAQMNEEDVALIGFRVGYPYSSNLQNLKNVVVPRDLQPEIWPYAKEMARSGYFVSAFGHKRIKKWPLVIQLECSLAQLGGRVDYSIPDTVYWKKRTFNYLFFSPTVLANFHPFLPDDPTTANALSGIHFGLGGSYNIVVKEHITVISQEPAQDPWDEDYMNAHIKAQPHFALLLTGGYDYFWRGQKPGSGFGLTLDFRAGFSMGDVVESDAFIYPDQDVKMQYFMITAGIMFSLKH